MDYSSYTKSIFLKNIDHKKLFYTMYIYIYTYIQVKDSWKESFYIRFKSQLSKQFQRSLCQTSPGAPTSPCQRFLAVPHIAQKRMYQAKHNFGFLGFDFRRKCGIFDDLILPESLESRKNLQIQIYCGTKWQYQLYTWKCIHKEMQTENTTPR